MNDTDKPKFVQCLAMLAAGMGKELTEVTCMAYWVGLNDLELDSVLVAINRTLRESTFFPAVAELRKLAGVLTPDDRAIVAYQSFLDAVKTYGSYKSVDFEDRAINATVRNLGGWVTFLERYSTGPEDEKWARKEFLSTYASLASRPIGDEESQPLGGISQCTCEGGVITKPKVYRIACKSAESHREPMQIGRVAQ